MVTAAVDVIEEIRKARDELNRLINRFKVLEDVLKGFPTRNYVIHIRKYLETLKNKYLKRFEDEMVKLRKKSMEARRKHEEEIRKRAMMVQKLKRI